MRSPEFAAVVGVALAAGAALLMLGLRIKPPAPRAGGARRPLEVFTGGVVVLLGQRTMRAITVATTFGFIGFGGVSVTAVELATHVGGPPTDGGRLVAAFALGGLAGSLGASRWLNARYAEWVVLAGLVMVGVFLGAAAFAPSIGVGLVAFALAGFCDGPLLAATLTLRQRESPAERLGQVNTTGGSLKIGAAALGAALTAVVVERVGAPGMLLGMTVLHISAAALGLLLLGRRPTASAQTA